MADTITAKDESTQYTPHPEGAFVGTCVDVIDLGHRLESFPGRAPRAVRKVAVVFMTGRVNESTGQPFEVAPEFTLSMYETARLRKFLSAWRAKAYTEAQAREGVALEKLVGKTAYLIIEHKRSKNDRIYAVVSNITPVPPNMLVPAVPAYERAAYWAERRKSYADELSALRKQSGENDPTFGEYPVAKDAGDDDDDLPF